MSFSIFIASSIITQSPFLTVCPTATLMSNTTPGIGAVTGVPVALLAAGAGVATGAAGAAVVTYLYFYSLIVSIIGLVQTSNSGEEGKGLSIAGIIISAIFILLLIIVALFFVISPAILIAAFEEYQPNEFYYY